MLGALSRCSGTPSSRNLNNNALARRTRHRHGASHRARSHTTCPAALPGSAMDFLTLQPYTPPAWASHLSLLPTHRYRLGILPTPIHEWRLPGLPEGVRVLAKRDDLSGMQLSGNKVRKLEFLMADAVRNGYDCVITIGGIQSNHARATAVAAKYLGLPCHLILRTSRHVVDHDPGLVGNLLVERMAGAHLHLVTKEEYGAVGSDGLLAQLRAELEAQGRRPYVVPVGGSSSLGAWGYLQAIEEVVQQDPSNSLGITDIAMACGSGGTTAGLALGAFLSPLKARVTAYGVCDTPEYFYSYIDGLLAGMGAGPEVLGAGRDARGLLRVVQTRGSGYAISTEEELRTVQAVSSSTGILLDPVYSGKAVYGMLREMREDPAAWRGRTVLFVHTGGLLGMYDKLDQLEPLVRETGPPVARMRVELPDSRRSVTPSPMV